MAILQWGLTLYVGALIVHAIFWRLYRPQAPLKVLVALFSTVAVCGLGVLYWGEERVRAMGFPVLANATAYLHVLVFMGAMGMAYTVGYTLLEWDSPTLSLVMKIARAGEDGVHEAALIKELLERPSFVTSRMLTLMQGGVLAERNGRYVLSRRKHAFYRFILSYGRFLRVDEQTG